MSVNFVVLTNLLVSLLSVVNDNTYIHFALLFLSLSLFGFPYFKPVVVFMLLKHKNYPKRTQSAKRMNKQFAGIVVIVDDVFVPKWETNTQHNTRLKLPIVLRVNEYLVSILDSDSCHENWKMNTRALSVCFRILRLRRLFLSSTDFVEPFPGLCCVWYRRNTMPKAV